MVAGGALFLATTAYLWVVVIGVADLDIDMFDEPERLLPWIATHDGVYGGMWLLYLVSQLALLPAPVLVARSRRSDSRDGDSVRWGGAVAGTVAVTIAIVGLAVLRAASPVIADGFVNAADESARRSTLVLHDTIADAGKELRLVSEVILGVWIVLVARQIVAGRIVRRAVIAAGCWTTFVATWKILQPTMELEDWVGFIVACALLALGVSSLRSRRRAQGWKSQT